MNPQSDSVAAFSVSRRTNTTTTGSAGLSKSGIPSANVSLGLSRSNQLTGIFGEDLEQKKRILLRPKGKAEYLKTMLGTELPDDYQLPRTGKHTSRKFRKLYGKQEPRYQWFWSGNYNDTELLTPDLKHKIKRHVAVKRVIPIELFPTQRVQYAKAMQAVADSEAILKLEGPAIPAEDLVKTYGLTMSHAKHLEQQKRELLMKLQQDVERSRKVAERAGEELAAYKANTIQPPKLEKILNFSFFIQIRIKKRYGRLHRLFLFSSNQVKGSTLRPTYSEEFHLRIDPESAGVLGGTGSTNEAGIPLQDTEDVTAILDDVKEKYEGKWYELQDRNIVEIVPSMGIRREERVLGSRMETTRGAKDRRIERELENARVMEARKKEHELKENVDTRKTPREFVRTTEGRRDREDRDWEEEMRPKYERRHERAAPRGNIHFEREAPKMGFQSTRRQPRW